MDMDGRMVKKSEAPVRSVAVALGLLLCGTAVGVGSALGFSQLLLDACQGDFSCQKPLLALFGGIGFTQALTIIAIYALVNHLIRKRDI